LSDQIEKNEMGGACSRGACGVLVRKLDGKRPLGRPRHRWENNSMMDYQEVGWGRGMDWIIWLRIETGGRHLSMR
jgi:hypothetical protein